ncbi:hypothetical protein NDU88_010576 [Pleurodeles waltl]|uniref:Uncharacterized protein n=1 Tax=Pleurodeles waltl TaxID=8319 RepID=A0AAV7R0Y6_PLEWA|nr:hypothetical protein NDU88_010576 [Pleurodeles waltl]
MPATHAGPRSLYWAPCLAVEGLQGLLHPAAGLSLGEGTAPNAEARLRVVFNPQTLFFDTPEEVFTWMDESVSQAPDSAVHGLRLISQ